MLKRAIITFLIIICILLCGSQYVIVSADYLEPDIYTIVDENYNYLFESEYVEIGDNYLHNSGKFYEIVYVDHDNKSGIAKFVGFKKIPDAHIETNVKPIAIDGKRIAMYMTHNDESFITGDGVDSVYGNGGIKDVALRFKQELEKHFVDVYFDDQLHIPHDTSAYSRSSTTAKKLLQNYSPDALFDIHRDGASRKFYIADVGGVERCKVRIVIGKANPNYKLNEEFALYLLGVAQKMYPWLFTDIFYAKGHYNQALDGKAILFEMGSHMVEKDLVMQSCCELADVVTTALYNTTVDINSGELAINGNESDTQVIVKDLIETKQRNNSTTLIVTVVIILLAGVFTGAFVVFYKNYKAIMVENNKK